jgi:hypothetical protein
MKLIEQLSETTEDKKISRRGLIIGTGKLAVGAAGLAAVSGGLGLVSKAAAGKAQFPWPYKKLDLDQVGDIAYNNWYKNYCCYAVTSGLLLPLQEKVGEPYTLFPVESTIWGHGGAVGWGTLCGTLTGVGIVTGLVAGKQGEKILNDVIAWYAGTELPIYQPAKPKAHFKSVNQSDSPLCHISVGRWMKKENVKFFSPERKERCARLSADIAMKTAQLLNNWADGKYKPVHGSQAKTYQMTSQNNCTDCHGTKIPKLPGV